LETGQQLSAQQLPGQPNKMKIIKKIYAQEIKPNLRGFGRIGLEGTDEAGSVFTDVISNLVGILTIFGLIWFMIQIIIAGYQFISAGGDTQKIKEAQQKIQNNFVGVFIVIAAIFLLSLVGELIGIPEILNLEALIEMISP
jgi:hypothetical protein